MEEFVVHATHKAKPFKALLSVIKNLLGDVNVRFDARGIRVAGVDAEKVTVTELLIRNLSSYSCLQDCVIGVYPESLYKLFRAVGNSDEVEFSVLKSAPKTLLVKISNPERFSTTVAKFESIELPLEDVKIPTVEYDAMLTIPTADLQRALQEISHISKTAWLGFEGRELILKAESPQGHINIKMEEAESTMVWRKSPDYSEQHQYFIKYIEKFIKPEVSKTVDVYFRKDYPLTLQYNDDANIGVLQFRIAPVKLNS